MELVIKKKSKRRWRMTVLFTVMATVLAVTAYTFLILEHDPALVNLGERLRPASMEHPLGTDQIGRAHV